MFNIFLHRHSKHAPLTISFENDITLEILCEIFSSHRHSQLFPITMFPHIFFFKLCCGNLNLNFQRAYREINRSYPLVRQGYALSVILWFYFRFWGIEKGLNKHYRISTRTKNTCCGSLPLSNIFVCRKKEENHKSLQYCL